MALDLLRLLLGLVARRRSTAPAPEPEPPDVTTGLAAAWLLNETGTGTRADSVGSLTLANPTSVGHTAGLLGNGVALNQAGVTFLARAASGGLGSADLADNARSFVAWLKPAAIGTAHFLMGVWTPTGNNRSYMLGLTATGTAHFRVSADGTAVTAATTTATVAAGQWAMLIGTHDPVANEIGIFLGTGGAITHVTAAHAGGARPATANNIDVFFGAAGDVSIKGGGVLDHVLIYDLVLDADQAAALYNAGAGLDPTA